jgi:hypothetical protein
MLKDSLKMLDNYGTQQGLDIFSFEAPRITTEKEN